MSFKAAVTRAIEYRAENGTIPTIGAIAEYTGTEVNRWCQFLGDAIRTDRKHGYPRSIRLRAMLDGFSAHTYLWLGLDEADSDAYLSSNEAIRALNSDYITPIHHKHAFQRATEPTIDAVPTIYGTIDRGRFEPTAAAESDLSTLLSAEGTLVLKPVSEGRGDGVYVLEDGEQARLKMGSGTIESTVADLAADLDGYLVTEFLEQHDYAASIYPAATNTIRIHTLVDPETGEISLHRPSHRFGSRKSAPIDNWSKGGYIAPVDLATGEIGRLIALDGASRSRLRTHPETDARVAGVTVPYWAELRDLVREAAAIHRDAPLVGWDVVVTEDGPVLLEGNARPSIVGLQLTEGLLTDERLRRALEQA